jgi:protein TonB
LTSMIRISHFGGSVQQEMFRWTGAALLAVALHAGLLAFLLYSPESADQDIAGAIAIELAPIAAGAAVEMGEVPPGPLTPEQAPASEATKEIAKYVPEEVPRIEPSPLAQNPEVILPLKQPEKKDEPIDETKKAEHAEEETRAAAASVATVPPRLEEDHAPVPTAPVIGLSAAARQARATWEKALVSHLDRYKRYPAAARAHRVEGQVMVQFTVNRAGIVVASHVVRSSGSLLLDDEAIAMLRRAGPLPTPPAETQGLSFDFVLPIQFRSR